MTTNKKEKLQKSTSLGDVGQPTNYDAAHVADINCTQETKNITDGDMSANNDRAVAAISKDRAKILKQGYLSFQKLAHGYNLDSHWAFSRWMSEPTTLEFVSLWEKTHNPQFDNSVYLSLCSNSLSTGTYPSIVELKTKAKICSIYVDLQFPEEMYIHRDLAFDFASWASPAFRAYCNFHLCQPASDRQLSFYSEEDFIISNITVAKTLANKSLEDYKKSILADEDAGKQDQTAFSNFYGLSKYSYMSKSVECLN